MSTHTHAMADMLTPVEMVHMIEEVNLLSNAEHEQIFKIIQQHSCRFTENLNGVFLNLAHLPVDVLKKIQELLVFWKDQQELFQDTSHESLLTELASTSGEEAVVHRASSNAPTVCENQRERKTSFEESTAVSHHFTKKNIDVICGRNEKRSKLALNNHVKQHLIKSGGSALRVAKKCIATEDEHRK